MADRFFTLIVVPERGSKVRRVQVPRRIITAVGAATVLFMAALGAATVHYFYVIDQVKQNSDLRVENQGLKQHLAVAEKQIQGIEKDLARVDRFDRKLREITKLSDPIRGLAIGPVDKPVESGNGFENSTGLFAAPPRDDDPERLDFEFALLESRLHGISAEFKRQESSLRQLSRYYDTERSLLENTPSVWPVRGWVTSEFGMRDDPYTGARTMHQGLDISTPEGKPVIATAGGTVVFAGPRGGYGNAVVIDHGMGVTTFYAHLSEMLVKAGAKVSRGQHIGGVGNTGRSTGPHLHYEIRSADVPVNPRAYILE